MRKDKRRNMDGSMATLTWHKDGPVKGRQALGSIRDVVYSKRIVSG